MPLPPPKFPFGATRTALVRAARMRALRQVAAEPGSLRGVAEHFEGRARVYDARAAGQARPAFRRPSTGEVVPTGAIHDYNAVPEDWLTEDLEPGFVIGEKFYTRGEAERLPAKATQEQPATPLSGGHSDVWLRARAEALRRHARGAPRSYVGLVREAEQGGGFTYDVKSGARPRRGFAFSASPENEAVLRELTPEAVARYVSEHEGPLREADAFLGAWRSPEGRWYLDVSRVLPDREAALKAARAARQRAVYDLASGETLEVGP